MLNINPPRPRVAAQKWTIVRIKSIRKLESREIIAVSAGSEVVVTITLRGDLLEVFGIK